MRCLFSVVLKTKFFNTSYLLLKITCDHLIRRFRTPHKRDTKLYRIVDGQISNLSLQQFTASARKHTEYLYPVVHKSSLQSVQAKKKKN